MTNNTAKLLWLWPTMARGFLRVIKGKFLSRIFSTKKSGTGLGLAIVNSIISDHHGQVSVADNNPTGTIVSFQLPVSEV